MTKAYILINLGAPEKNSVEHAEIFLREFLSDKCVLNIPAFIRLPLSYYISKKRGAHYANNIARISPNGEHPLLKYTNSLAKKISEITKVPTYSAYRYGKNSIAKVVSLTRANGATEIKFLPMYPQNALSTSVSTEIAAKKTLLRGEKFCFLPHYFDCPQYISLLAKSAKQALENCDTLVASFHSIPVKDAKLTPYEEQCNKTVELLSKELGIEISLAWQSKMGRGKWLEPSTESVVRNLAKRGKSVAVICPGFSCDCTETLLEIDHDLRGNFLDEGGKKFHTIPCLNDSDDHAVLLSALFNSIQ